LAFFLIVPSVMVIGVLLVHALAKRLGLKIYYSTLTAVALLSFVIIFAAVFLSPVPDKKFLVILGGLILSASLLLTFLNNFLIKRERAAEKNFTEEVKAAYAEELKKDSAKVVEEIVAPIEKFEWENAPPEENKSDAEPAEDTPEDEPKEIFETEEKNLAEKFPLENVFKPLNDVKAEAIAKALETKDAEPFEKPKPEDNFPLQEVFKPLEKISSESASKALETKDTEPFEEPKPEDNFPLQETFKALDEVKPEMLEKIQTTKPLVLQEDNGEFSLEQPPEDDKISAAVEEISETESPPEDGKPSATVEEISETESPPEDDKISATVEEVSETESPPEDDKISATVEEVSETESPPEDDKISAAVEEISETESPLEYDKPSATVEEISETESPPEDDKISAAVEEISETESPPEDDKISAAVEEISETESPPEDDKISATVEDVPETESPLKDETLDDLLDKAYDARGKGHIWQAIENYRKALERYGADEYAPFVAIDLGNLYKENALYSKAIKTYEDALNLPAIKHNDETKREFAKNLEYLRVVRDVLLKYRAATTPFAKIPKEILQEIDAEYQKAQLHSSQYK